MELLINVENRVRVSKDDHANKYALGDVVTAHEDGWAWSPAELTNPDWRIFVVPGLTRAEADALRAPEWVPSDVFPRTLKKQYRLQLVGPIVPPQVSTYLLDATRRRPSLRVPVDFVRSIAQHRGRGVDL